MSRCERQGLAMRMKLALGCGAVLVGLASQPLGAQEASVVPKAGAEATPTGVKPALPEAAAGQGLPDLVAVESAEAIKRVWRNLRNAYNRQAFIEVCQAFDTLLGLSQDVSSSAATAGYAYLQCARRRAINGQLAEAENYLKLSIRYGGERPEHDMVRAIIDRDRGMEELNSGNLEKALRLLEIANARGSDPAANEVVSAQLTSYAYEMHGRGDDVRALAALDAALLFYPTNRQAEILRREIWMWDYGVWIIVAIVIFGLAVYAVFRQYREVRLRETVQRGF